ncbi:MAG: hypothetical protein PHD40_02105, partial [Syntrophomonadaceae bacterium]|nr:hypothetical protein [Syntrophomonadaceae bacterium]
EKIPPCTARASPSVWMRYDKLVVADLVVEPGVEILTDLETMLAAVLAPSRAAVEEEETAEEPEAAPDEE